MPVDASVPFQKFLVAKTKLIGDWFARRPRWHRHYTPTSSSWINQVERFFALLSDHQIKRGAHRSKPGSPCQPPFRRA